MLDKSGTTIRLLVCVTSLQCAGHRKNSDAIGDIMLS